MLASSQPLFRRGASLRGALLSAVLAAALLPAAQAQVSYGGEPVSGTLRSLGDAPVYSLEFIDLASLMAEDARAGKDEAWRFGAPVSVDLGLANAGTWTELDNGDRLWRLTLHSDGAYSLNCRFDQFQLPAGARLFVYNSDRSMVLGAFTKASNKPNGQFAIQPVAGESITLELLEPAKYAGTTLLHIDTVVHDYRDFYGQAAARDFGDSGSCNNNVVCPEGAPWANEIRSVGMLLEGGFRYCSGAMINNTADNGRQLFLTAYHCTPGANDIIMFNYQSPTCSNANGPTNMTVQGLNLLASSSPSDFNIVEAQDPIPAGWNVYLSGWDATGTVPTNTVGIHHPSGDVKKISFDNQAPGITGYYGGGTNHWNILNWEDGTTEGGSSGSPLYNPNHQIIGQLHGGDAFCGNNVNDYYGRLSTSYGAGLAAVLNPGGGVTSMNGRELAGGGGGGPLNDQCSNAIAITDGVYAFDTSAAAADVIMPCAGNGGPDVWYSYNSSCGATVTVSTCNDADYDTALGVWADCGTTNLLCNDDFGGCSLTSQITFNAAAGVTYYIQVAGYAGDSGTGNLTVSSTGGVPNQTCATATTVGVGSTAFNTTCTTQSLAMTCASGGGPDLWYSYTAPSAGTLEVNTCGGAAWDTALALYNGCGGTVLACNDDNCGTQSRVTAVVASGSTTYIQVSGYAGASGSGTFNLLFTPSGVNNNSCAGATVVGLGATPFSTVGATTDGPDEPGACTAFGYTNVGNDIWFSYTPAVNADVTASLCGSAYDTKIAAYAGACPTVASAIACNDDFCSLQSQITFSATAGTPYLIRVGGYNAATGSGTLTLSQSVTCADYTPLSPGGLAVLIVGNNVLLDWTDVSESVVGCPLPSVLYTVYATDGNGNTSVVGTSGVSSLTLEGYNTLDTVRSFRVTATEVVASANTVEDATIARSKPVEVLPTK